MAWYVRAFLFVCYIRLRKKFTLQSAKIEGEQGWALINPLLAPVLTVLNVMQNFSCIFILIKPSWWEKAVGEIVTKVIHRIIRVN